jgi:hypothetical protein
MTKIGLLLVVALSVPPLAFSESAPEPNIPTTTRSAAESVPAAAQTVTLGDAAVTLAGPWRFKPGDSPWVKGAPVWARPAFNDAGWAEMDLRSSNGTLDPAYGNGGYLKGWTAHGFPHLWGFAWYRIRVRVSGSAGPLWLKMPDHVDDAYQVYANGRYVGEFGHFTARGVKCYRSHPLIFELPPPDAHGDVALAVRFYMESSVLVLSSSGNGGGMHQAPVLGIGEQIELLLARANTERVMSQAVPIFVAFLMLVAGAGAFRLWLLDRPRTTYLWLALAFIFEAAPTAAMLGALFTYAYTQGMLEILDAPFLAFGPVCWILFWRHWFGLERSRVWAILRTAAAAAILLSAFRVFQVSPGLALLADEVRTSATTFLCVMLFITLLQGARKDRTGALVALPPVILVAISLFNYQLINWFHIRTSFFPFGVEMGVADIAGLLLVLVVGALTARRFLRSQVKQQLEQQAVEQDLEQARELQQHVLIPEPVNSAVFRVETAYHPAQTVGGDFFQALAKPDPTFPAFAAMTRCPAYGCSGQESLLLPLSLSLSLR